MNKPHYIVFSWFCRKKGDVLILAHPLTCLVNQIGLGLTFIGEPDAGPVVGNRADLYLYAWV